MAKAVTVSAIVSGTTSETPRLDATAEIAAARTDISGVSSRLEASLKRLEVALMASCATFMTTGNTDMPTMAAEGPGITPMMAGDSSIAPMTAGGSGMASMIAGSSVMAATLAGGSGVAAILAGGSEVTATLVEDSGIGTTGREGTESTGLTAIRTGHAGDSDGPSFLAIVV